MSSKMTILLLFVVLLSVLIFGIAKYEGNAPVGDDDGDDGGDDLHIVWDEAALDVDLTIEVSPTDYMKIEIDGKAIIYRGGFKICLDDENARVIEGTEACLFEREESD